MQDSKKDTVTAITATVPNSLGWDSAIQRERSQSNFFWHPVSGYISVTNRVKKGYFQLSPPVASPNPM